MESLFWFVASICSVVCLVIAIRDLKKTNIAMKRRDENIERIANALENSKGV